MPGWMVPTCSWTPLWHLYSTQLGFILAQIHVFSRIKFTQMLVLIIPIIMYESTPQPETWHSDTDTHTNTQPYPKGLRILSFPFSGWWSLIWLEHILAICPMSHESATDDDCSMTAPPSLNAWKIRLYTFRFNRYQLISCYLSEFMIRNGYLLQFHHRHFAEPRTIAKNEQN